MKIYQCSKKLVTYEYSCFDSGTSNVLMHSEVAWVLVSSETPVQAQIIQIQTVF